jgi:aminodeoxyfutalosine deaminase
MPISLRARLVCPVDRPPISDGVITIEGERIVAVEPTTHSTSGFRDLGDVALVPGFVNAHTHLEFSHLQKPLGRPGMRLVDWLPLAIAERQSRGPAAEVSIALGIQESVLAGTAAIGEISTAELQAYPSDGEVSLAHSFEVIGFSRARAESAFAALEARLAAAKGLDISVGISPHAPYTVSPELLSKIVKLAERESLPVAMHLAESAEELDMLATGQGPFRELLDARSMWDPAAIPRGTRPLDYLRRLEDAPRALVIHGNYLDREEHEFLAARADRMSLVYCPRTHAYFDHPPYPLAELLAAGVHVALGTDSRASNPDLSLLGELRHAARAHRGVAVESILKMATLDGARALGCENQCGSITPGKLANLVALPMRSDSLDDIVAEDSAPAAVWLRGREV